jgi:prepilin-type N-terminal cleavage/methylation domain-containing protein
MYSSKFNYRYGMYFTMSKLKIGTKGIPNKGFTLVEMAIVLIILGLLLGGLLSSLSAQFEYKSRNSAEQSIENIKEALMGYALVNGYLPCPDGALVPTGVEGVRDANGRCPAFDGTLPWQTLNVDRTDAWERYFRYSVTNTFSNSGIGTGAKFSLSSVGGITVKSDSVQLTNSAAAVIVSHGSNGYGAKNTTQVSPANNLPNPTGLDESENMDLDLVFVSHTSTPQGSANEFDDIVSWISPNILYSRMVAAGKLP